VVLVTGDEDAAALAKAAGAAECLAKPVPVAQLLRAVVQTPR
jgi:FixJ family two-component response regulator